MDTTPTQSAPSSQFSIKWYDVAWGLVVAILSPVFTIILTSIDAGNLVFEWDKIGGVALAAGLSYILKNFLQKGRIVITDPATVKAVKEGDAEVKVTPT